MGAGVAAPAAILRALAVRHQSGFDQGGAGEIGRAVPCLGGGSHVRVREPAEALQRWVVSLVWPCGTFSYLLAATFASSLIVNV